MRAAHLIVGVLMAMAAAGVAVRGELLIALAILIVCAFWLAVLPD